MLRVARAETKAAPRVPLSSYIYSSMYPITRSLNACSFFVLLSEQGEITLTLEKRDHVVDIWIRYR